MATVSRGAALLPPVLAGALVFGVSGSVLVLEILAARLPAPYVGLTLETYTAISVWCWRASRPGPGRAAVWPMPSSRASSWGR